MPVGLQSHEPQKWDQGVTLDIPVPSHKWLCALVRASCLGERVVEHQLNFSCQVLHELDRETLIFSHNAKKLYGQHRIII